MEGSGDQDYAQLLESLMQASKDKTEEEPEGDEEAKKEHVLKPEPSKPDHLIIDLMHSKDEVLKSGSDASVVKELLRNVKKKLMTTASTTTTTTTTTAPEKEPKKKEIKTQAMKSLKVEFEPKDAEEEDGKEEEAPKKTYRF